MMRLSYQFLIAGEKRRIQGRKIEKYGISEHSFLIFFVTDYVLLNIHNRKAVYCLTLSCT
jgi:hypothetical protein